MKKAMITLNGIEWEENFRVSPAVEINFIRLYLFKMGNYYRERVCYQVATGIICMTF